MRKLIAGISICCAMPAFADPAPFGLEVGKATISDAKKLYKISEDGTNKYSNGPMYSVPTSQIDFDGLNELTLIFDNSNVLVGVLAILPKHQFKSMHQSLSGKYKVVSQEIPFVGNSSAKYVNGNTEITLNAPHLSFDMSMNYLHKELVKAFEAQSKAEAEAKKKAKESML